ncbi:DUF7556 family protein [Halomarina oriensis]|uniref:DUF7556 family protein n=1 Tax=Halomarina oriensis TaxID=671145 RepID=UPI0018EECF74|nr:hypothetical protein [Halomarina oriensis]
MSPDSAAQTDASGDGEVMAAVADQRLVIADISRDETWLSVPLTQAVSVEDYR